jgi:hypothetical protein
MGEVLLGSATTTGRPAERYSNLPAELQQCIYRAASVSPAWISACGSASALMANGDDRFGIKMRRS